MSGTGINPITVTGRQLQPVNPPVQSTLVRSDAPQRMRRIWDEITDSANEVEIIRHIGMAGQQGETPEPRAPRPVLPDFGPIDVERTMVDLAQARANYLASLNQYPTVTPLIGEPPSVTYASSPAFLEADVPDNTLAPLLNNSRAQNMPDWQPNNTDGTHGQPRNN